MKSTKITSDAELRSYVVSVTAFCVFAALSVDVANQLTFFVDWPTALRSWAITTSLVLGLAAPITRVVARAQLQLYRVKRMFAALSATNEAIVRSRSSEEMFHRVCEAAVGDGKFNSVALALAAPGESFLRITAIAGPAGEIAWPLMLPIGSSHAPGRGLAGVAFHSGKACISNDYQADPRCAERGEEARLRGVRSCAAIPLRRHGETIGVMLFGSNESNAFNDDVAELMKRLANNVGFAMETFEQAEQKAEAEARIRHMATHDALTDLPNRSAFGQVLSAAIESAAAQAQKLAVLFIDLDRFKIFNDSLGHDAGDSLLVEIAARLGRCVDPEDVVARLGGDEFVVLLAPAPEPREFESRAREVLDAISQPLSLGGVECRATASIGVAVYPEDGEDQITLMKNADKAMYMAKDAGKNDYRFYVATATRAFDGLALEARLRQAVERSEFSLHYQPKVDARTRAVTGLEALLRWSPPDLGPLQPTQFIPLAEETGLIVPIGRWVLREACAQTAAWLEAGHGPLTIAVNISPRQFMDPHLLDDIDQALADSGLPPHLLQIEITESMMMRHADHAIEVLQVLRKRGVRVAIDDFGTGYSSMSLMKKFPIDTLKIDRSFVSDLPDDGEDRAIVTAIIHMGKALGLAIVAEGVETEAHAAFLRENLCDELQGFLFSRPLPAEQTPDFLAANARRVAEPAWAPAVRALVAERGELPAPPPQRRTA